MLPHVASEASQVTMVQDNNNNNNNNNDGDKQEEWSYTAQLKVSHHLEGR